MGTKKSLIVPPLRMIAWEVTRNCNLNCIHCRASADVGPHPGELSREECLRLIDAIASFSKPVVILTGGEPLLRNDIFEIAAYGNKQGLRMVMAINGTLLDPENIKKMQDAGIQRISVSLDGATSETHDEFRRVKGAFAGALQGIEYAKAEALEFQINTTITRQNLKEVAKIHGLAKTLGAKAHHIFVLVPTGRGKEIEEEQKVSPEEYEKVLRWFYEQEDKTVLQLKATCAPQYYRMREELRGEHPKGFVHGSSPLDTKTRGCLGGVGFCFISHVGQVSPCGYLELDCGNVRKNSFHEIWSHSRTFMELRDFKKYEGKCGSCKFVRICGGCRARAFYATGNYLGEDPYCTYDP
ncbi:MAG TPA: heme b synthase [Thermodesulfobacteriota bacterium]|nr:heme b synthase [Thermodesulfobacteriota bacterium]